MKNIIRTITAVMAIGILAVAVYLKSTPDTANALLTANVEALSNDKEDTKPPEPPKTTFRLGQAYDTCSVYLSGSKQWLKGTINHCFLDGDLERCPGCVL